MHSTDLNLQIRMHHTILILSPLKSPSPRRLRGVTQITSIWRIFFGKSTQRTLGADLVTKSHIPHLKYHKLSPHIIGSRVKDLMMQHLSLRQSLQFQSSKFKIKLIAKYNMITRCRKFRSQFQLIKTISNKSSGMGIPIMTRTSMICKQIRQTYLIISFKSNLIHLANLNSLTRLEEATRDKAGLSTSRPPSLKIQSMLANHYSK